jgi:putative ABC transport system permease protein
MRDPFFPTRSRDDIAADNREELRAWIDERTAELIDGGMNADAARRIAEAEFGDAAGAERYAVGQDLEADRRMRLTLWIAELISDLRIAARTLRRTPAITAVILLTFALGIGATTSVFSVVYAMLLRPLPYGEERALIQLQPVEHGALRPESRFSAAAWAGIGAGTTSFLGVAAVENGTHLLIDPNGAEQIALAGFTANAFTTLGVGAALGRTFTIDEERGPASSVIVLLDGLWRRRFSADPSIVGRTIELASGRRTVVGVMPASFRVPTYEVAEGIIPRYLADIARHPSYAHVRVLRVFARLNPGVTLHAAQADLDRAMRGLQGEAPHAFDGIGARAVPIRAAVAGPARPRLLVMMGAAACILLIACANVAGILLARALARRHELAIRVALGAGRRRLIRQFLAEGAVLGLPGAALGLLVAEVGIGALRAIAGATLPPGTHFALEPRVLAIGLAAAVVSVFAAALMPALVSTRSTAIAPAGGENRAVTSSNRRMRLGLVAAQLAVAVVLLVGAGLLLRTLHRLSALDLGYSTERTLTFRLAYARPHSAQEQDVLWSALYEQLRTVPGVTSVGGGNLPTNNQSTFSGLDVEGRVVDGGRLPHARYTPVSDDYFAVLRIPILRGRSFDDRDRDGAMPVAIVSAGLARQMWPAGDPIGARVKPSADKPWSTIVGIAGDVRMGGAEAPISTVYTSQRQDRWPGGGTVILRLDSDPGTTVAAIREAVKRVDPTVPVFGLRTLDEIRVGSPEISGRRVQMQLFTAFALIALAVSAVGVYGVSAYAMEARRREFGIRMALGASPRSVIVSALGDAIKAAVLGALAGVPFAWLLASRMRELLYEITPFDPAALAASLAALIVVVVAASSIPARRAAQIDPAYTMKAD